MWTGHTAARVKVGWSLDSGRGGLRVEVGWSLDSGRGALRVEVGWSLDSGRGGLRVEVGWSLDMDGADCRWRVGWSLDSGRGGLRVEVGWSLDSGRGGRNCAGCGGGWRLAGSCASLHGWLAGGGGSSWLEAEAVRGGDRRPEEPPSQTGPPDPSGRVERGAAPWDSACGWTAGM
ncbi:hypothetical protein FJT64_027384 [Amphibalanus amphitrite]|uniref:Uncharacterized protein n=1 Tax=Amphibalanus amphitrite TaxID=1232801 RepID=A0A6A4WAN6_AMPAM|nr:hypothetical protein FJT64_027384 [Amphibalanus amphitrite]